MNCMLQLWELAGVGAELTWHALYQILHLMHSGNSLSTAEAAICTAAAGCPEAPSMPSTSAMHGGLLGVLLLAMQLVSVVQQQGYALQCCSSTNPL
jgi:hypothetical protein